MYIFIDIVVDSEYSRSKWLFSKMGTKLSKIFVWRASADIKSSNLIVRNNSLRWEIAIIFGIHWLEHFIKV